MSGFADYIDREYQNTMASDEDIRARSCQHPLERTNMFRLSPELCGESEVDYCQSCLKPFCVKHCDVWDVCGPLCLACQKAEMDAEDAAIGRGRSPQRAACDLIEQLVEL